MATWEEYLQDIYYDPKHPSSFSSVEKLYNTAVKDGRNDITYSRIKTFLQKQETYSMHRAVTNRFRRNKVLVIGKDDQWEMDLMDMTFYAKYNNGVKYVLLVIDVFSKFVWLKPLKNKSGSEVKRAIENIFHNGRIPRRIRSDKGGEFFSRPVQTLLQSKHIRHFTSHNHLKANIAERAIKTIKMKIQHYITYKQNFKYVDHLQDFADSYNSSQHRSTGFAPKDVSKENDVKVWKSLYWPTSKQYAPLQRFRYEIGDYVRLTYLRRTFQREYDQKWTGEIFKVSRRYKRGGIAIYKIKDFNGNDIEGTFYQGELQKVTVKNDHLWKIDRILKQRRKNNKTEYLVRWLYWPKSFDSCIDRKAIIDI